MPGRCQTYTVISPSELTWPHSSNNNAQKEAKEAENALVMQQGHPRRNIETHRRLQAALTAAKQLPITPTARTILDIQTLGLSLVMIRFDGKSNTTYAT
jgi:hypothetical protein